MKFKHYLTKSHNKNVHKHCKSITLFCGEFYVTSHIIHLTQYIDKTYSVKQMCASVLNTEINHKTILWNKVYYANKEANECMETHFYFLCFLNSIIISKIA